MRNNKGFTLMELVAAIFIGGMVTAALVLVWRTASTQTSQGQRQTIIRNQVSSFQRQLYRDFYSADVITFPNANLPTGTNVLLAGLKKAKRISTTQFETLRFAPQGPTSFFVYCLDNGNIRRLENNINYDVDNPIKNFSSYGDNLLTVCRNNGVSVLSNFTLVNASVDVSNGKYFLQGSVRRTFNDVQNTTPIYIEINETLISQGGI